MSLIIFNSKTNNKKTNQFRRMNDEQIEQGNDDDDLSLVRNNINA